MSKEKPPKELSTVSQKAPPKKRGRPKKSEVAAKKPGNRGVIGRPKGDAAIMNEYKARMLASPKSAKVLESVFDAALDNEHKHQAAAWKLLVDRLLPVAAFEQEVVKGGGKNSININITGLTQGDTGVTIDQEASDGDFSDPGETP